MDWVMVHKDQRNVELGQCRVPHDELGYPLLLASLAMPEMRELIEGLEEGHTLTLLNLAAG